jgi:hypothetical protein
VVNSQTIHSAVYGAVSHVACDDADAGCMSLCGLQEEAEQKTKKLKKLWKKFQEVGGRGRV